MNPEGNPAVIIYVQVLSIYLSIYLSLSLSLSLYIYIYIFVHLHKYRWWTGRSSPDRRHGQSDVVSIIVILFICINSVAIIIIIINRINNNNNNANNAMNHNNNMNSAEQNTVGFHNFNLRIVNLRVSNPSKLIVDVLLTRCRISMCQGLGPKQHDEISEIDRTPSLLLLLYY